MKRASGWYTDSMPDILERCIRGEQDAFEKLVDRYSGLVSFTIRGVFHEYCPSASNEDLEDLHNGVFLSLMEDDFKRLRQFKGLSSFATYLRVITVRRTVDFLRGQKRAFASNNGDYQDGAPPVADANHGPDVKLEILEEENMVGRAIRSLSPGDRLLLKLTYVRELPAEQVASILRISINAYYTRKNRALSRLKKMCKKLDAESSIRVKRHINRA